MHTFSLRVYYEDTDSGGVVYHANYLKFIERARSEIFFSAGKLPESDGGVFVVRRLVAEYLAPARLGDQLVVKTTPLELRAASLSLKQVVLDAQHRPLFEATVSLAFVRAGRPVRIGEAFRAFLQGAFGAGKAETDDRVEGQIAR